MKRTVFLAVALFALMAVGLYAQTEADFDVSKSADGKSITITKYNGKATTVNIPAKIQNLPVTSVRGFKGNTSITSVTIPESVTEIELGAFQNCTSLTSVTFGGAKTFFNGSDFPAGIDLAQKYKAGGAGTYTRPRDGKTWTKQ